MSQRYDAMMAARHERLQRMLRLIGSARATRFSKPDCHVFYVVHPSTYQGCRGQWQVTRFDERGPTGHHNENTFALAVASAIGAHPNSYWNEGDEEYSLS